MRLAYIVDMHGDPRTVPWLVSAVEEYDAVLIGGDIGREIMDGVLSVVTKKENTFMVFGNHDFPLANDCPRILHGTKVKYRGLTIGGLDGSLPTAGWPNEHDETEYLVMTKNLGPVDVLLLHQPPKNTGCDTLYDGTHIGSVAIWKYIKEMQPRLAVSGHIHESPAIDRLGRTILANPGPFYDGNYLVATIGRTVQVERLKV